MNAQILNAQTQPRKTAAAQMNEVVTYGEEDLRILKACFEHRGFQTACNRKIWIPRNTLLLHIAAGTGERWAVEAITAFSRQYFTENNLELPKAV